jgi:hypothetical protein
VKLTGGDATDRREPSASAWRPSPDEQGSHAREEIVTGSPVGTVWSHSSRRCGRNDVVRNANGKNRMKLVFTAAGSCLQHA